MNLEIVVNFVNLFNSLNGSAAQKHVHTGMMNYIKNVIPNHKRIFVTLNSGTKVEIDTTAINLGKNSGKLSAIKHIRQNYTDSLIYAKEAIEKYFEKNGLTFYRVI